MEIVLIIVSIILIALVLLQSGKASDAGQIITGGNSMLMGQMKERGAEKFLTRLTYLTGLLFIVLSMIMGM
ncbi:MAG TPA: preprotein translocase subunit SecG [Firmicutes bacterium]|jgi:preprotein translocase subunit SecG|nr:preprotein translocase subunit SecG [Bacillota bacterium]